MTVFSRLPILKGIIERMEFKKEMASLNERFKKQDALWEAIDNEQESWLDVEFCPTFVDSYSGILEGFVKSDGHIIRFFEYSILEDELTTRELNENELSDAKNHQTFAPLNFDYVTLDGWYEHSEGWDGGNGCSPGAAVGHIENNGDVIGEFAFCFRCRKLEIKPKGFYLSKMLFNK